LARKFIRQNAWSLIKWIIGVPAFLEVARLYEHWEPLLWSMILGLPFPSGESAFWGYLGLVLIAVASVVIGSDIVAKFKSHRKHPIRLDGLRYQNKVREELRQMRVELADISNPRDIYFSSWNEKIYQDQKEQLIGNDEDYKAIELLSSALNERNRILKKILARYGFELAAPDLKADFLDMNEECVRAYDVLFATQFFPRNLVPQIVVVPAEDDSKIFKEFQIRCRDGIEHVQAQMYFITIKNVTGPSINALEVVFTAESVKAAKVGIHRGPFLMIMSAAADHLTMYAENITREEFRNVTDGLRIELLNIDDGKLASRRIVLHQGDVGKTFALIFTVKDSDILTIPSYYTRSNVWMPCRFTMKLYLTGDSLPSTCVATFHIDAENWYTVHVRQILNEL
jgi:hypothetical protein